MRPALKSRKTAVDCQIVDVHEDAPQRVTGVVGLQ